MRIINSKDVWEYIPQEILDKFLADAKAKREDIWKARAEQDYPIGYFEPGEYASDALKTAFGKMIIDAEQRRLNKLGTCEDCNKTDASVKYRPEVARLLCDKCYAAWITKSVSGKPANDLNILVATVNPFERRTEFDNIQQAIDRMKGTKVYNVYSAEHVDEDEDLSDFIEDPSDYEDPYLSDYDERHSK